MLRLFIVKVSVLGYFPLHKDIEIDCDYIISKFEIRNPRRMQLINILD